MVYLRGGVCALVAFREKRGAGCKSDDGFTEPELRQGEDEAGRGDGFTELALRRGEDEAGRGNGYTEPELGRGAGDRAGSGGTWDSGSCFYYSREDASGKEMELSEAEVGESRGFFCGRWNGG